MIPWIQVYSNIATHPKTSRLAKELNLTSSFTSPAVAAVGIIVSVWIWAVQNALDGDLSDVPDEIIADACRWKKDPKKFVAALTSAGFLDPDRHIHDWETYTLLLLDMEENRKENDRKRAQQYRQRKRDNHVIVT